MRLSNSTARSDKDGVTLLLDLGNTRLKWALWDGGALSIMQALPLGEVTMLPSAARALYASSCGDPIKNAQLLQLLDHAGISAVACAGPPRNDALLTLAYAEPGTLGVDRWLAMRAARKGGGACVVASVGTALTVDAIDAAGRHCGGCIAPGPAVMRGALLAAAPHLRDDGGKLQDFATSTANAVYSGPLLAAAALIQRQRRLLAERSGTTPRLLLTGGAAMMLLDLLEDATEHVPDLVLRGLSQLASG